MSLIKSYTFWLTAAVLFQFLTAAFHSISFFAAPQLKNDTERQLHFLLSTYKTNMGAGFERTFLNLFTALSACFPLLCLLGALTVGFLLLKHAEASLMRGIIAINLAIFGVCFIVMLFLSFLPPIVATGLIVLNLLMAYIFVPKHEAAA